MSGQIGLDLGLPEPPPPAISPRKAEFVEGIFATWLAMADGKSQPTVEHKRRGRMAAEAALRALA